MWACHGKDCLPGRITSRLRPTLTDPAALPRSCSRRPNLPSSHVSSGTSRIFTTPSRGLIRVYSSRVVDLRGEPGMGSYSRRTHTIGLQKAIQKEAWSERTYRSRAVKVALAIGATFTALAARSTARRISAPGPRERKFVTPWELGIPHEDVSFRTEDGLLLGGWWLPSSQAKRTVIALHGHRGARHHCVGIAAALWRRDRSRVRAPALRSSTPKRAEARRYQPCQLPAAARLAVGPFLSLDPLRVQLDRGRKPVRSGRRGDRLAADLLRTRLTVCHLERRPSVDRCSATAHERQDSVVGQEALRG